MESFRFQDHYRKSSPGTYPHVQLKAMYQRDKCVFNKFSRRYKKLLITKGVHSDIIARWTTIFDEVKSLIKEMEVHLDMLTSSFDYTYYTYTLNCREIVNTYAEKHDRLHAYVKEIDKCLDSHIGSVVAHTMETMSLDEVLDFADDKIPVVDQGKRQQEIDRTLTLVQAKQMVIDDAMSKYAAQQRIALTDFKKRQARELDAFLQQQQSEYDSKKTQLLL